MLLFDAAVELTVGAVFALGHREELARSLTPVTHHRAFRQGLVYSALLYVASAAFFFVGFTAWNTMYLVDLENSPTLLCWAAYLDSAFLSLCYIVGFVSVARALRRTRLAVIGWSLAAMWSAVCLLLFVVLWTRSFVVTSYQEFVTHTYPAFSFRWGEPDSFFGHRLMWWLLFWCVVDFAPLAYLYGRARQTARGSVSA